MSKRETIEFGYTDQYGDKQIFKTVDVTGMTEADIRHIKNQVYKEMYAALINSKEQPTYDSYDYQEEYNAPQCGCNGCTKTVPNLESEIRVVRRELEEAQHYMDKLEGQVEVLKELLKEAWKHGN